MNNTTNTRLERLVELAEELSAIDRQRLLFCTDTDSDAAVRAYLRGKRQDLVDELERLRSRIGTDDD
jgi:hypothetical protein